MYSINRSIPTAPSLLHTPKAFGSLSTTGQLISTHPSILNSKTKSILSAPSITSAFTKVRTIPIAPSIEEMLSAGIDFKTILAAIISQSE